jgi:hypothetical protein
VVVVVVGEGNANVIGAMAASALGGFVLTTMAQFVRSLAEVPHVDGEAVDEIVPVTTVTDVVNVPVALVVAMATVFVSQSVWLVDAPRLMHSRAYSVSLSWKPVPETDTAVPLWRPVFGVNWMLGPAAEAVAAPMTAIPPIIIALIAMVVMNRLIVNVLPLIVLARSPFNFA